MKTLRQQRPHLSDLANKRSAKLIEGATEASTYLEHGDKCQHVLNECVNSIT